MSTGATYVEPKVSKVDDIEALLCSLDKAVNNVECLAERITGEGVERGKGQESETTNRTLGCLLTELPRDLESLESRLAKARADIQNSLY